MTVSTAEGCRITYSTAMEENEVLYGPSGIEEIQFPPPEVLGYRNWGPKATWVLKRLLPHLNRGVLLWVAPEGIFLKRQCQSRVYWKGPLAPHKDQPNKLEREKTYWLLDTQQFLQGESRCALFGFGLGRLEQSCPGVDLNRLDLNHDLPLGLICGLGLIFRETR
uniref:Interferon regulatory factor-3 domain-containing protein n=1 Tax=Pseudonaja textilis TaxID=8673 RepID=A0A670ZRZ3_PSETE